MKKFLPSVFLIFSAVLFFSCTNAISVSDSSLKKRPDVEITSSGLTVSVKKVSVDEDYINIYRRDVTNENSADDATTVNIGIIYPAGFDENNACYIYEDVYVTAKNKYQYMARYHLTDGTYYNTAWTDTFQATNGNNAQAYSLSSVTLTYSESTKVLSVSSSGTISAPSDSDFVPTIAVSNGTDVEIFPLTDTTVDAASGSTAVFNNSSQFNLADTLSFDFLNTEITITGLVGQKTVYVDESASEPVVKKIIWTAPCALNINGSTSKTITVSTSSASSGLDYSDPS